MGGGSFDTNSYRSYTKSVVDKPVEHVYKSRKLHEDLDPKNITIRESRDSPDNPLSTPIITALDMTGSMGMIADHIAKGGLGTLFQGIFDRKPVTNPHLMFMGIGDANYGDSRSHRMHDQAPLQVSQFEADNRIVDQLTKLWLEKGGGGNNHESYDLAWYFAGRYTVHDSMVKRGKRGYLFTIGDELTPETLFKDDLKRIFGSSPEADVPSKVSLEEAQRLYNVFHVVIEQGDYARRALPQVREAWTSLMGQQVIFLSDYKLLPETIVSAIQVAEGVDHKSAASGWGVRAHEEVIGNAVRNLPRGVPAPRQLGR
jgi:hypothetical protein